MVRLTETELNRGNGGWWLGAKAPFPHGGWPPRGRWFAACYFFSFFPDLGKVGNINERPVSEARHLDAETALGTGTTSP